MVDRHQAPGEDLAARPGRLQALPGCRTRIPVAAADEVAELRLVEAGVEVSAQDPGNPTAARRQALQPFPPARDAHRRWLGVHRDEAQLPAAREGDHGAWHAEEEARLVRERSQRKAGVEAPTTALGSRHHHRVTEPVTNAISAKLLRKRWGQLLDAEQVRVVSIDQLEQRMRIGAAKLNIGREHGERLVAGCRLGFGADRSRQDGGGETGCCNGADDCGGPVAQGDRYTREKQRGDCRIGREPHQRGQRGPALQSEDADGCPQRERNRRYPDQPVSPCSVASTVIVFSITKVTTPTAPTSHSMSAQQLDRCDPSHPGVCRES